MTISPVEDPDFLPIKLDLVGRRALFVRLSAEQRAEASFLDERALQPHVEAYWAPMPLVAPGSTSGTGAAPDFIFHIGHCGSTLLSRLLHSWPELQVLREPLALRDIANSADADASPLATGDREHILRWLLARWSAPQRPHQRVLVKATSTCNALIEPILGLCPDVRAILLDAPLETYLATIFKSDTSIRDAAAGAVQRWRLLAGDPESLQEMEWPQVCAMGWLAEQFRFAALLRGPAGARLLHVNFDDVLARPAAGLAVVAAHLSLDAEHLDAAMRSRDWERYSKAREHAYGAQDRLHDLTLARQRFAPAIAAGKSWVREFLKHHPDSGLGGIRLD